MQRAQILPTSLSQEKTSGDRSGHKWVWECGPGDEYSNQCLGVLSMITEVQFRLHWYIRIDTCISRKKNLYLHICASKHYHTFWDQALIDQCDPRLSAMFFIHNINMAQNPDPSKPPRITTENSNKILSTRTGSPNQQRPVTFGSTVYSDCKIY